MNTGSSRRPPWTRTGRVRRNGSCTRSASASAAAGEGARETSFDFFVPEDMVGKFRGVFATRAQNTSGSAMPYTFHANGEEIGEYTLKGGVTTEVEIPGDAIVAGWNRIYWKTTSSGYWVNIDWHKFTVGKPPKGTIIVIR